MRPRHINDRRVLLGAITVLALCLVAAFAFFMSTATPGSRVHLGRGTTQPAEVGQGQPLAVGVDPETGDTTVVSKDEKGGVQQVTIPGTAIQQSKSTPLSEEPKSAAPQGKAAGD
jgi:hypothetical protein